MLALLFSLSCQHAAQADPAAMRSLLHSLPPAGAEPVRPLGLSEMMGIMKQACPSAVVSGRFHDWRAVSVYRRNPGLHNGYDIAMPAGTRVPAAWAGRVVAVVPWYGPQHGITVQSGDITVTYGHLCPLVRAGDTVHAGQVLGTIAIDHVDVKMRTLAGTFVDFGDSPATACTPATPDQCLAGWLRARLDAATLEDEIKAAAPGRQQARLRVLNQEEARAEQRMRTLESLLDEGVVSTREFEQARARHARVVERLRHVQDSARDNERRLPLLRERLDMARRRVDAWWQACMQAGLSRTTVEARLARHAVATRATSRPAKAGHAPDWEQPEATHADLQRLRDDGAISDREFESLLNRTSTGTTTVQ